MLHSPLATLLVGLLAVTGPQGPDESSAPDTPSENTILIRAEQVYVKPGQLLEDTSILVRDGLIVEIGKDLELPEGAREVSGKTVCAGYIDPWSNLGIDVASANDMSTRASTRTAWAVDPFGREHAREAARNAGVLLVRAQAGANASAGGLGVLLRARPAGEVVVDDAGLQVACGVGGRGDVFSRVSEVDGLIGQLGAGLAYHESLRKYEEELAEWEAEIAEVEEELEDDFKKAKKNREKEMEEAEEKGKEFKEERYKEDRKPRKPRLDPDKDVFGRVANGELPLVVGVEGGPEIRALLEQTRDYSRLRMVLRGANDALPFAKELAERGIPVILYPDRTNGRTDDPAELAGKLAAKGVRVLIGTRGGTTSVRSLPLLAQRAMAGGMSHEQAFGALTLHAAQAFDAADRFGSVEVGKQAELLILDGDPVLGHPTAVMTGGELVVLEGAASEEAK